MSRLLSNEIKVSLYLGNLNEENTILRKEDCVTVVQYRYDSVRNIDKKGFPIVNSPSILLDITLRNFSHKVSKHFLTEISRNSPSDYTFLFNASFDDNKVLKNSEGRMIARGYVVEIEESFDSNNSENSTVDRKLMKLKILLSQMTFNSENSKCIFNISND